MGGSDRCPGPDAEESDDPGANVGVFVRTTPLCLIGVRNVIYVNAIAQSYLRGTLPPILLHRVALR